MEESAGILKVWSFEGARGDRRTECDERRQEEPK